MHRTVVFTRRTQLVQAQRLTLLQRCSGWRLGPLPQVAFAAPTHHVNRANWLFENGLLKAEHPTEPERKDTEAKEGEKIRSEEAKSSKTSTSREPQEFSVAITPKDFVDASTFPVRMMVHHTALRFLNYMVPNLKWNWKDFSRGAEQAIRTVHEHLATGDVESLRGLLTDGLLEELKQPESPHHTEKEEWCKPPRLMEINVLGLFSSSVAQEADNSGVSVIQLTPLVKVHEEYWYEEDEPRWTIRLLRWRFEQRISEEEMGEWQIASLEEKWFREKLYTKKR